MQKIAYPRLRNTELCSCLGLRKAPILYVAIQLNHELGTYTQVFRLNAVEPEVGKNILA